VTDSVLLLDKLNKLEFLLKICYLAADLADLVAKEDILLLLGAMLLLQELLLVEIMEIKNGADLIHSQIVIIIVKENMAHALLLEILQLAKKNVKPVMKNHTVKILENYQIHTEFHQKNLKYKLKL
jgi:hypothetical protein